MDLIADRLAEIVPIAQMPPGMQHEFDTFCKAPSVAAMELAYYRVCVTEYNWMSKELTDEWDGGQSETCRMYRIIKKLKMPGLKRVVPKNSPGRDVLRADDRKRRRSDGARCTGQRGQAYRHH